MKLSGWFECLSLSISLELLDSAQAGAGTAIYVALVNMS
jgi:hypothetical protein